MRVDRSAQLACRRSGSSASAIARSTHTRRAPAASTSAMLSCVDAADREERHGRVGGRVAHQLQAHRADGRAWSGSRARDRRRCSRRRAERDRRSCRAPRRSPPAHGSRARSACPGPTSSRTSLTGMSSWPTCTPSAPACTRDEGPVVDDRTARRGARTAPARRRASASRSSSSRGASRAAARRPRRRRSPRAAGRRSRSRSAGRQSHTRYSRAAARRARRCGCRDRRTAVDTRR